MFRQRYLLLLFLLPLLATTLIAQPVTDDEGKVGIGTNVPDPSAILDLTSTTGGLLIPRMTSAERDLIPNPAEGLMIYNLETGRFEFNAGSSEEPLWVALGGDDWQVRGNAGTNPASNFLGTTDDQPIAFRTNNVERFRLTDIGLIPGADDSYDLGSPARLWRDLYLGPGSLHIISNITEADWSLSIQEGESSFYRDLLFRINGTTRMVLSDGGDLTLPSLGFTRQGGNNLVTVNESGELSSEEPGGLIDDFAWALGGNTGTSENVNFLGTTDAQGLMIRTNNVGRVQIAADGTVGIGPNAPDPSALLDMNGIDGGLLIPRTTTGERDGIANPATGLLVFNTTTARFEYNAGTPGAPAWTPLGGGGDGWGLEGNGATTPATNFLGTTDDQPVAFRTNDVERMRLTEDGLMPGADDTYDLGSMESLWRDLYLGPTSLHIISNETEADWSLSIEEGESPYYRDLLFDLNGTERMILADNGDLTLPALGNGGQGNHLVLADPDGELLNVEPGGLIDDYAWSLLGNSGSNANVNFLGTTDAQGLAIRTNNLGRILVTSDGNTLPGADNAYDLGAPTVRWQDIHLGPGSLHIHSTAAEADSAHDWSLGIIGTGTGQGALQIAEDGNGVMTMNSQGNVGIGAADPAVSADLNGALAIRPPASVTATTTSTTTITVGNRSYIRVDSDDQPDDRPITLSDGLQDGQVLVLQCVAECQGDVEVENGIELQSTNVLFDDNDETVRMYENSTITMIWDDNQSTWVELSRTYRDCFGGE